MITAAVAAISAGVELVTRARQDRGWRALEAQMHQDVAEASLQGLLRARIAGARILAAEPDSAPMMARLAFIGAWLATDYGLRSTRETIEALERLAASPDRQARDLDLARALLALTRGERDLALRLATAAARAATSDADSEEVAFDLRPLLVLARARALAGDPLGASKAAEAAIVREPRANAPLLAFAEARLDLGQAAPAEKALRDLLARVPDHSRALLLLRQARQARPVPGPDDARDLEALLAACRRDGAVSPVIAAGCDLAIASEARASGNRGRAHEHALRAASREVVAPRVLAGTALVLAQLGRIDAAERLAEAAARTAAPGLPPLAWARVAILLGRGELGLPPAGLAPSDLETRLLAARAALTAGGPTALGALLAGLGPAALAADTDLRALALLTTPPAAGRRPPGAGKAAALARANPPAPAGSPADPAASGTSPVYAYAQGLRARVAGDTSGALRWLLPALDGHGDACRAAGEYVATARLAGHPITSELDAVRALNPRCLNLALPPPTPAARRPRPRPGKAAATPPGGPRPPTPP